jgi:hypothetical protein
MIDDSHDHDQRKARAASLRRQIERLTQREQTPSAPPPVPSGKSPRDLIHEKMRELYPKDE